MNREAVELAFELKAKDLSNRAIADVLGVDPETIRRNLGAAKTAPEKEKTRRLNLEAVKRYKAKNKEKVSAHRKKWRAKNPDKARAIQRRATKLHRRLYPLKHRADVAVYSAVKRGALVRGSCEICGAARTDAHHDDYSKPLAVRWLCHKHHMEFHRNHDFLQPPGFSPPPPRKGVFSPASPVLAGPGSFF